MCLQDGCKIQPTYNVEGELIMWKEKQKVYIVVNIKKMEW